MAKDNLGYFDIPDDIFDLLETAVMPEAIPMALPSSDVMYPPEWRILTVYEGTPSTPRNGMRAKHTVSIRQIDHRHVELSCSCQGFRIQKKGYCKHTERAQEEFAITNSVISSSPR